MGPDSLKRIIKPQGHLVKNRRTEIIVGLIALLLGVVLLWDAFDGRGKKMPWPASGMMPW